MNRSGTGYKRENSRPRLFAGRPLPRGNVPPRPIAGILLLSVVRNETRAARNHLVSACLRAAGNTRSPRMDLVRVPLPVVVHTSCVAARSCLFIGFTRQYRPAKKNISSDHCNRRSRGNWRPNRFVWRAKRQLQKLRAEASWRFGKFARANFPLRNENRRLGNFLNNPQWFLTVKYWSAIKWNESKLNSTESVIEVTIKLNFFQTRLRRESIELSGLKLNFQIFQPTLQNIVCFSKVIEVKFGSYRQKNIVSLSAAAWTVSKITRKFVSHDEWNWSRIRILQRRAKSATTRIAN